MSDTHNTVGGFQSAPISQSVERQAIDAALQDTADRVSKLVPSRPGVGLQELCLMLVRYGIGAWGVHASTVASNVTGSEIQNLAGILAVAVMLIWGYLQKKFQNWREHQTALASAAASAMATSIANAPVALPVQPGSATAKI